ncbi:hypothetical protein [Micromonospora sp. NBS 11-29]|uniref:hypothetical protein n=1 Tax=Micromonospora sp. NBS 11-29 TaxID=1960879 RepID=UPI0011201A8C|nr:hypothetical protein [Micromonospora sp. NBS 11-29]
MFGVLGFLLARQLAVRDGSSRWEARAPEVAQFVGVVVVVLGALIEVGAIVWAVRWGRIRAGRESPMWALGMRKRSRLVKRVRRGDIGSDDDLPTLTVVARQMVAGGWWAVLAAGLVLVNLGQALIRVTSIGFVVLFGLVAALFALAAWQVHRDARRAATFLRQHPAEPHGALR